MVSAVFMEEGPRDEDSFKNSIRDDGFVDLKDLL